MNSLKTSAQAALKLVPGGNNLIGLLSEFWAQTGTVASWRYATIGRHKVEAVVLVGGGCRFCPDFGLCTLAFVLQLEKNHGKTSVRSSKSVWLLSAKYYSFRWLPDRAALWPALRCASYCASPANCLHRQHSLTCSWSDHTTGVRPVACAIKSWILAAPSKQTSVQLRPSMNIQDMCLL